MANLKNADSKNIGSARFERAMRISALYYKAQMEWIKKKITATKQRLARENK